MFSLVLPVALIGVPISAETAPETRARQIEEVVVTAERRESTVQDTSISITAFTGEFLDDFGIRNQEDLQNYIPATVILPYDITVRGVGRTFRALGGDPGVATYMNGIYSEDSLTATAATFFDVERIEILRGPQGTLYGRNAVGGAMNVLYKGPTDEFEGALQTIVGDYGTQEYYGAISGPLIEGQLAGRATVSYRDRDGVVEEIGPEGSDLDSLGTENVALQLRWTPIDAVEFNIRKNWMDIDRTFGSANGGGLVVLSESAQGRRNTEDIAPGFRFIDLNETDPTQRTFYDTSKPVLEFTDPFDGSLDLAQPVRPGVDVVLGPSVNGFQNAAASLTSFGVTTPEQAARYNDCVLGKDPKGDDVCAATSGLNWESFEQRGTQANISWQVTDNIEIKYLYGYNTLSYQRITDFDNTASPVTDRQFYVNHEADYESHELQAFVDLSDTLSFTSGIFFYDATIDQRGDFFSSLGEARMREEYQDNTSVAALGGLSLSDIAFQGRPMVTLYSAKNSCQVANPAPSCSRNNGGNNLQTSKWYGDDGTNLLLNVKHGPRTTATDLLYATQTKREAFAAYTQGVWDINDTFTLTLGVRYAWDDIKAEENLFRYSETGGALLTLGGGLTAINLANGGLLQDANGNLTPTPKVTLQGIPFALSVYRPFERKDEKWTGRINLDWNLTDEMLMYFSVTSGYRSGGYSLVYFSRTPTYSPEQLVSYEIGLKTQFLDNTLQLNGSIYYYDYNTIHTFATEVSPIGGTTTSVLEAPGAEIKGIEVEGLWLATEHVTVGGSLSYTPSEYTDDLFISDLGNTDVPPSLYPNFEALTENIKGNQLLQVPEGKATGWASYRFDLSGGSSIELFGVYSWIDEVYFTPFEGETTKADAYDRVDVRATWTSSQGNWTVSGFVNNVFDEVGVLHIERNGESAFFRQLAATTAPRLYGLELTLKMGGY
jgi:outer membrane receptor protein involved in Fe transport